MGNRLNLIGQQFGRLTVREFAGLAKDKHSMWLCACNCGRTIVTQSNNLKYGHTNSCGCLQIESAQRCMLDLRERFGKIRGVAHGFSGKRAYGIWYDMIRRCTVPKCKVYKNYGGRGITVCDGWLSFDAFFHDMGDPPPSMELERIDNSKGYSKSNCKWATRKEQCRNTRRSHFITYNGETLCASAWAERIGIDRHLIYSRLKSGWSIEETLTVKPLSRIESGRRSALFRQV